MNVFTKFILCLLFATTVFSGCQSSLNKPEQAVAVAADPKCIVRRAAIDIGSGSLKLKIARVDFCDQKIIEVLFSTEEKVDFKESLSQSLNQTFSPEVLVHGKTVIIAFKEKALALDVPEKNIAAIATAAFREAKNAKSFALDIYNTLKIPVTIISQHEEGVLGFYSALGELNVAPNSLVVWDIGAASQQITTFDTNKNDFEVYEGRLASVSLKDFVIKTVQRSKSSTPNPLSKKHIEAAIQFSKNYTQKNVSVTLLNKIKQNQNIVYGIGGVHALSIANLTNQQNYTLNNVVHALSQNGGKTDQQIGGAYASTEVTNLALVAGAMIALDIQTVNTLKINNTNGVLMNPKFW